MPKKSFMVGDKLVEIEIQAHVVTRRCEDNSGHWYCHVENTKELGIDLIASYGHTPQEAHDAVIKELKTLNIPYIIFPSQEALVLLYPHIRVTQQHRTINE